MKGIVFIAALLFAQISLGSDCVQQICNTQQHKKAVVVNNYAQAQKKVVVQQQNQKKNENVVVKHNVRDGDNFDVVQKTVEFDADYFLGVDGYFDVGNHLYEQAESVDREVQLRQSNQIDKLIQILEKTITNKQESPVLTQPVKQEESTPVQAQPVSVKETDDLNSQVFRIFKNNCMDCHGANGAQADIQLVDKEESQVYLMDLSLADRLMVYDSVADINLKERGKDLMPLGGDPLSPQEIEILRLWAIQKAEEARK